MRMMTQQTAITVAYIDPTNSKAILTQWIKTDRKYTEKKETIINSVVN